MPSSEAISGRTTAQRPAIELAAMVVGATFLLVGILGFVPGVTQNFDNIEFAGHESGAELLGLFQVSILHNVVHALFGIAGLLAARTVGGARTYLIGGCGVFPRPSLYRNGIRPVCAATLLSGHHADKL